MTFGMIPYCLNETELKQFIEVVIQGRNIYDDEEVFRHLFNHWQNWEVECICLTTTFSIFLEQQLRQGVDAGYLLHQIFVMSEETGRWLRLEGFGEEFVTYIFQNSRNETQTIDEDLNDLCRRLADYEY